MVIVPKNVKTGNTTKKKLK